MATQSGNKQYLNELEKHVQTLSREKAELVKLLQPFASFYEDVKHLSNDQKTFVLAQMKAKHVKRAYEYLKELDEKYVKDLNAA